MTDADLPQDETAQPQDTAPPPRRKLRWLRWLWLIPLAAVVGLIAWRSRQPPEVEVVQAQQRRVAQTLTASGRVAGAREVELSVEQPGVLTEVLVAEGDLVAAGQVVARTSTDIESAELAQAEAGVRTARAQVDEAQASARSLPASVEQARAESEGAIRQAREQLAAAEARLAELRAGGREQERREAAAAVDQARAQIAQAEKDLERARSLADADATARAPLERARASASDAAARVGQAEARLAQAERDLTRARRLFDEGVSPEADYEAVRTTAETAREALDQARAQLRDAEVAVEQQRTLLEVTREAEVDRAETSLRAARQALEQAQARLDLVASPARREQIEQAEAQVRSARAALRAAEEAGPARVETVRLTPAQERVQVARRQLEQALRARDTVLARLEATEVTARFDGIVTSVVREAGDVVSPGQAVVTLSEMDWPEVHLEIDERDIARVQAGQDAFITADAYPREKLSAVVDHIAPEATTERGVIDVVLRPDERPLWLRSGMTVDASIVVAPAEQLLVLPTTAVVQTGEDTHVLVVEDGVTQRRSATVGVGGVNGAVVLSGVSADSLVVRSPTGVQADLRVRTKLVEVAVGDGL